MAFAYDASVVRLTRRVEALEAAGGELGVTVRSPGAGVNAGPAIQAALDSGAGSPVLVYLPDADYYVWPASAGGVYPGNDCLRINYSNVTLMGAGRWNTTIHCLVAGGLDPNTNWELTRDGVGTLRVWRGNGIALNGSTIANTAIRDLRLTGESPRNLTLYPIWGVAAGQTFPADTDTGEDWDITHKGVIVGNGTTRTDTLIEDCEIDSFRGEIIYYGGSSGNQRLTVRRCFLHDCIGSIFSCSGSLVLEDSEISLGENAVEDTPIADPQYIRRNYIHDNKVGVVITTNAAAPTLGTGLCEVTDNRIEGHFLGTLWVLGAIRGYRALRNVLADNPHVLIGGAGGGTGPQDITIADNVFRIERLLGNASQYMAFDINDVSGSPAKNIRILRNRGERSQYVADQGTALYWSWGNGIYESGSSFTVLDNDFTGWGDVPDGSDLWLVGQTADTLEPTMSFQGVDALTLAPSSSRTYTTYTNAPADRLLRVAVNANTTISDSSTVKLAGGTSFAPGGTGGVITFIRPEGRSAIYEVSRFTY